MDDGYGGRRSFVLVLCGSLIFGSGFCRPLTAAADDTDTGAYDSYETYDTGGDSGGYIDSGDNGSGEIYGDDAAQNAGGYDEDGTYGGGTDGSYAGGDTSGAAGSEGYTDASGSDGYTDSQENGTYGDAGYDTGANPYGDYSFNDTYDYDTTIYGPDTNAYDGSYDDGTFVWTETSDGSEPENEKLDYRLDDGRRLLIIGDSRTVGMRLAVQDFTKDVTWCCLGGKGYNWMTGVGVPAVEGSIDDRTDVVCLMGVNDAWDEMADEFLPQYSRYMNQKAREWKKKGARTFYVSVNPVRQEYVLNTSHVSDQSVQYWNAYMKKHLSKNVTYIDTYSAIKDHMKYADDIHYEASTYRDIFRILCVAVQSERMGWTKLAGTRYFSWGKGAPGAKGWLFSGGKWFYLNADGSACSGWKTIGGVRYYLRKNGNSDMPVMLHAVSAGSDSSAQKEREDSENENR